MIAREALGSPRRTPAWASAYATAPSGSRPRSLTPAAKVCASSNHCAFVFEASERASVRARERARACVGEEGREDGGREL